MKIDLTASSALNPFWSMGGNTCHAELWLRDDLLNHLKLCKRDLGFTYVRCHGHLNDRMDVVREDGSFNFAKIGQSTQNILELGMKPFFELSGMPSLLASGEKTITHYRMNTHPPKEWGQWYKLINELMSFLENKYGADELKTWYFEVWNEPDIGFWAGTQAEYFKLYDLAAKAIKEHNPAYRVGGPATARTNWIDEFLGHVTKPSADFGLDMPRCDFVSTHAYPSDLEFLDSDVGDVELQNSTVMYELFAEVRKKVDGALGKDFPVIIGEWNSSAGPLALNHDECNNGPFVAKTLIELMPLCQGSLVWNISDIYEECGFHATPFHGGYGQLNVNGIPKASYHAFAFLNQLHNDVVDCDLEVDQDGLGCLATTNGSSARVLVYYYDEPGVEQPRAVTLAVPAGVKATSVQKVLPGQGSAYEKWLEQGSPEYLTLEQHHELVKASEPVLSSPGTGRHIEIPLGTMALVEFTL